jgi:hypothetical protein
MRKTKVDDNVKDIINRILTSPVPEEGQLMHPIQSKKRDKKEGQITLGDIDIKEKNNVADWNAKDFVDYFAKKFQEVTNGNYRRVYRADGTAFQAMLHFFASNGLDKSEWTKKFIDWAFSRRDLIQRKFGYFNPHTILNTINYFYQDEILPLIEGEKIQRTVEEISLLDELTEAFATGGDIEVFVKYGIPITATYMIHVRNVDSVRLVEAIRKRLVILIQSDRNEAKKIFHKSIINSPYRPDYEFLDWRDMYSDIVKSFELESWWRENDYKGKPLAKYREIVAQKSS